MMRWSLLVAAGLLAACSPPAAQKPAAPAPVAATAEMIADGREIAETQCASCHAVDADVDQSPRPDAPAFNIILSRYHADVLGDDLRNAIHLGHEEMPTFEFNPQGVDSLIAYLQSIQKQPPKPAP